MTLRQHQSEFIQDVAKLIDFAFKNGFELTAGELFRSPEQQAIYVKTGRSKTLNSLHLSRLAVDFNIFKNGKLATKKDAEPLGAYWESLDILNSWGGNGKKILDVPHFSRGIDKAEWSRVTL